MGLHFQGFGFCLWVGQWYCGVLTGCIKWQAQKGGFLFNSMTLFLCFYLFRFSCHHSRFGVTITHTEALVYVPPHIIIDNELICLINSTVIGYL